MYERKHKGVKASADNRINDRNSNKGMLEDVIAEHLASLDTHLVRPALPDPKPASAGMVAALRDAAVLPVFTPAESVFTGSVMHVRGRKVVIRDVVCLATVVNGPLDMCMFMFCATAATLHLFRHGRYWILRLRCGCAQCKTSPFSVPHLRSSKA